VPTIAVPLPEGARSLHTVQKKSYCTGNCTLIKSDRIIFTSFSSHAKGPGPVVMNRQETWSLMLREEQTEGI
jgi:hypothetical protein